MFSDQHKFTPKQKKNRRTTSRATSSTMSRITSRINSRTTINIGKISGGSAINIVPGKTEIMCEIRSHSEKTIKIELNKIKKIIQKLNTKYKKINKKFNAKIKINRIYDSIDIPKNSLIMKEGAFKKLG